MKILHITEAMGGGVANIMSLLAQAQAKQGHEVVVAHSMRPDTPKEQLGELFPSPISRQELTMVTEIRPLADLKSLLSVTKLLQQSKPDVIHLHSSKAGVVGRVAARVLGMQHKVFYTPHGLSFLRQDVSQQKQRLFKSIERFMSACGGTIVACSASEADLVKQSLKNQRVVFVENSVDVERVPAKQYPVGPQDFVQVVTSGRVCYPKAPWRFAKLAQETLGTNLRFKWLGDGELREDLQVNQGKLPENLEITGWLQRHDLYTELLKADIFVLPSLWEGMPLALIEAQVVGLPCIVTDVTGCRDVVENGVTGFVCKDEAELLEKLRLLASDAALRQSMGLAARNKALSRFNVDRMAVEMQSVYQGAKAA